MNRYIASLIGLLALLCFTGCASRITYNPYPKGDLTQENWREGVDTNTSRWAKGADDWFLTGDVNPTEAKNMSAPYSSAMSTMNVRVPDFNNLKVNGPIQVQVFGTDEQNSVYIYGPNTEVRRVIVEVRGNTLCIDVAKDVSLDDRSMAQIIVRVGVRDLRSLVHNGSGRLEGRMVHSRSLAIAANGSGNIYLSGNVNLQRVNATGNGCVSVFGAITPSLDITTSGSGSVNVSGNLGIRKITHHGRGNINIVGANSDGVQVYADGRGKIGIYGRMNICNVTARNDTCVFAYYASSGNINAYAMNNARIGVAGSVNDLYIDTKDKSRFEGRYLCAVNAYARASGNSHINVTSTNKLYASASQSSSIYFFGTPDLMSQFTSGNGVIIPVWFDARRVCYVPTPSYKGEVVSDRPRGARTYRYK